MMHHVPRTRLTVLAVAGPVERGVRRPSKVMPDQISKALSVLLLMMAAHAIEVVAARPIASTVACYTAAVPSNDMCTRAMLKRR
jgi:hypothetical protein